MSNSYFQFKQFTVHQEKAALKVSTDSCLFGAWVAAMLQEQKTSIHKILDIGAGTGLLMLMLAQKTNASIDGIEIDEPAYQQASDNCAASPWNDRLHVIQGDIKTTQLLSEYDFIISNPPFYEGDLKSVHANRNKAMHDEGLKLVELLIAMEQHLNASGRFSILLPWSRAAYFIGIAQAAGFFLQQQMIVTQTDNHPFFRAMFIFGKEPLNIAPKTMSIRTGTNYSVAFVNLLKDYYLYL